MFITRMLLRLIAAHARSALALWQPDELAIRDTVAETTSTGSFMVSVDDVPHRVVITVERADLYP